MPLPLHASPVPRDTSRGCSAVPAPSGAVLGYISSSHGGYAYGGGGGGDNQVLWR